MKNLHPQMFLILVSLWILSSLQCSTTLVRLQGFPLKSIRGGGQSNIITKLEENRIHHISSVKRQTLLLKVQDKDGLSLKPSSKQDSIGLVLPRHLSMWTPMKQKMLTSSGHISGTVGKTLCIGD